MKYMRLEDIKISSHFANSVPKSDKINECRQYWNKTHEQDRYIVVDYDNVLIDGYIQYLVLKENDMYMAEVQVCKKKKKKWSRKNKRLQAQINNNTSHRERETTYIYGIHPNSKIAKERVWRVPNSWWSGWAESLNIGDRLLFKTKYGLVPIEITKIERSSICPVNIPVKTVVRKNRNEEVI